MKSLAALLFISFAALAQTTPWVGELSGIVTNARGRRPIASVEIDITGIDSGVSKSKVSSASGQFKAEQLPVGKYKITFRKKGFRSVTMQADIINGKDTGLLVTLVPDPQ